MHMNGLVNVFQNGFICLHHLFILSIALWNSSYGFVCVVIVFVAVTAIVVNLIIFCVVCSFLLDETMRLCSLYKPHLYITNVIPIWKPNCWCTSSFTVVVAIIVGVVLLPMKSLFLSFIVNTIPYGYSPFDFCFFCFLFSLLESWIDYGACCNVGVSHTSSQLKKSENIVWECYFSFEKKTYLISFKFMHTLY